MKREELEEKLSGPTGMFTDGSGEELTFYLAYPATKENDLRAAAIGLSQLFRADGAYIEVNIEKPGHNLYDVVLSAPELGTPLFFDKLSGLNADYEELLQAKEDETKVKLGLYIHQKEVQRTAQEIAKIKAGPEFDENAAVTGLEHYFVTVKIPVAGKLTVKSDDALEPQGAFVSKKPGEALAIAAAARESANQNKVNQEPKKNQEKDETKQAD